MKFGKIVLVSGVILSCVLTGCVSSTNETTGEKEWVFAPADAVKGVITTVTELPDETKASVLEGLAWLLGTFGVGVSVVPVCTSAAGYFRNRSKGNATASAAETDVPANDQAVV